MAIATGTKAPTFSLYNSSKQLINLEDYQGKKNVLLLFFPLAFSSVCTAELCAVRDDINKYESDDTVVLGISVDSTYALARFKEDQHYNFDLLSDFNKNVSRQYDALYDSFGNMEMAGVSKRAAFIIDQQGIIQYAEVLENPGKVPDFNAIGEKLKELSVKI